MYMVVYMFDVCYLLKILVVNDVHFCVIVIDLVIVILLCHDGVDLTE